MSLGDKIFKFLDGRDPASLTEAEITDMLVQLTGGPVKGTISMTDHVWNEEMKQAEIAAAKRRAAKDRARQRAKLRAAAAASITAAAVKKCRK